MKLILSAALTALFLVFTNGQATEFTGCLTRGGKIINVAEGTSPKRACKFKSMQISWNLEGPPGPPGPAGLGAVVSNSAPTANDDMNSPYSLGSVWIDTSAAKAYILVDNTANAAVWTLLGGSEPATHYAIGDPGPAGGIVFYITDGGLHGLEAAPNDSPPAPWGCFGTPIDGAEGTVIGTGSLNTADILAGCSKFPIAAEVFITPINGVLGWFLPSKDELNELYLNRSVVGDFDFFTYWSSSEFDDSSAWFQYFLNGFQNVYDKSNLVGVRAVRAF